MDTDIICVLGSDIPKCYTGARDTTFARSAQKRDGCIPGADLGLMVGGCLYNCETFVPRLLLT